MRWYFDGQPWFPKRDDVHLDQDLYFASVLALLKPWRDLKFLKSIEKTWEQEFNLFLHQASQQEKDIIAGLQYYYESKSLANNQDDDDDEIRFTDMHVHDNDDDDNLNDIGPEGCDSSVSYNDIRIIF